MESYPLPHRALTSIAAPFGGGVSFTRHHAFRAGPSAFPVCGSARQQFLVFERGGSCGRQGYRHTQARRVVAKCHCTAVAADDGGGQAEAKAAAFGVAAFLQPVKTAQDFITFGFGNAGAGVTYFDGRDAGIPGYRHGDLSRRRAVAHGVFNKINNGLGQHLAVAVYSDRGVGAGGGQGMAHFLGDRGQHFVDRGTEL